MSRSPIRAIAFVFLFSSLYAIEKPFQTGKILDVQQKSREQILYYLVNTPITRDNPYFQVSVQLKDAVVVGEYTPLHASETLPEDWKIEAPVDVRLRDKHHMSLRRPGDGEIEFVVVRRTALEPARQASPPSGNK